jgi:hypothetical protein
VVTHVLGLRGHRQQVGGPQARFRAGTRAEVRVVDPLCRLKRADVRDMDEAMHDQTADARVASFVQIAEPDNMQVVALAVGRIERFLERQRPEVDDRLKERAQLLWRDRRPTCVEISHVGRGTGAAA